MNTNVDVDAMRKDAVEIFQKGFACSESVIYAIKKGFDLEMSDDAIAMSSGFPWGLGDGGCILRRTCWRNDVYWLFLWKKNAGR